MLRKSLLSILAASFFVPILCQCSTAAGADLPAPTTLVCVINASASRGYGYFENRWLGVLHLHGPSNPPFNISVYGKTEPRAQANLERVFSGLETESPTVREIKGKNSSEYRAKAMRRFGDMVILLWDNAGLYTWIAQIHRDRRIAIVASLSDALTYSGGELETMDCR